MPEFGRLTAFELKSLKIPSTMLCDSMVGSLFQHHSIHAIGRPSNHRRTVDLPI